MSIYQQFVDAGCETDSHQSDLYVKASPEAWEIIKANMPVAHSAFKSPRDNEH